MCISVAAGVSLLRAAVRSLTAGLVLIDRGEDDQTERDQPNGVHIRSRFVGGIEKGKDEPRQRQQPEGGAEEQKQSVASVAPEAHEEEARRLSSGRGYGR